jgi:lambda family phage portal protein
MSSRGQKNLQAAFGDMRADYDFMKESRFIRRRTGLASGGAAADYHIRSEEDYYKGIEKARDVVRNDMVVGQALNRRCENIIQDGFSIHPRTGDSGLDLALWTLWDEWSKTPEAVDVSGELTWNEIELAVTRAVHVDGDILAAGLEDGQLQLHEAHTIKKKRKSKNVHLGVEIDEARRRKQFWISKDPIDAQKTNSSAETSVPLKVMMGDTRVLFHIYNGDKRISQTRGISELSRIFALAGMVDDINFAKMLQQQIASCFAVIREQAALSSQNGQVLPSVSAGAGFGESTTQTTVTGEERAIQGIQPGMLFKSMPGEKIRLDSPAVPNQEFFAHIRLLLQLLGVNLGIPLVMMLLDGSETNFSGFRGAMDEARRGFKAFQRHLINRFHTPIWRWKVKQWIEGNEGGIAKYADRRKVRIFDHEWNPPNWPYLEPLTDASGDLLRLRNHLTSPRRLHAEKSRDYETVIDEVTEDNGYAIEAAILKAQELNDRYPDAKLTWRDVLQLPTPEGVQISIPVANPNQPQPTPNTQPRPAQ